MGSNRSLDDWLDLGAVLALGNSLDQVEFLSGFSEVLVAESWGQDQLASLASNLLDSGVSDDVFVVFSSLLYYITELRKPTHSPLISGENAERLLEIKNAITERLKSKE